MPHGVKKFLLLAPVLAWSGCASQLGPPASPAVVSLSGAQASDARQAMNDAVPPEAGPPLVLRPASGVRWTDVVEAVHSAGQAPAVSCAVVSVDMGQDAGTLHLRTAEGWPVVVRATRGEQDIGFDVVVGPYPDDPAAKAHSIVIKQAIVQAIEAWGRRRRVPKADPAGTLTP